MNFNREKLRYKSNPSKSYLHRYLILTSFIDDTFYIENISLNNDIKETIDVLIALGKDITIEDNRIIVKGSKTCKKVDRVYINESGSTLRLLLPLLAYYDVKEIYLGERLKKRPISLYSPFIERKWGKKLVLKHGEINTIDGSVSSQFISGLLIYNAITNNHNKLIVKNEIVSKNYIDITFDVLSNLGFIFDDFKYIRKENHINNITIENDFSSAANYIVYGLLKGGITIPDLNVNSKQGDRYILDIFKKYIKIKNGVITVKKCNREPIRLDVDNIIDLVPILVVYACFANGVSQFRTVGRLKDKESDRLNALIENFKALGISYAYNQNNLYIEGTWGCYPHGKGRSFNDHRIAMALIVFGLINEYGVDVDNIECIKKSHLNFI